MHKQEKGSVLSFQPTQAIKVPVEAELPPKGSPHSCRPGLVSSGSHGARCLLSQCGDAYGSGLLASAHLPTVKPSRAYSKDG